MRTCQWQEDCRGLSSGQSSISVRPSIIHARWQRIAASNRSGGPASGDSTAPIGRGSPASPAGTPGTMVDVTVCVATSTTDTAFPVSPVTGESMTFGSYKQFCPVAMAAEILCTRWTVVLLRELVAEGALASGADDEYTLP